MVFFPSTSEHRCSHRAPRGHGPPKCLAYLQQSFCDLRGGIPNKYLLGLNQTFWPPQIFLPPQNVGPFHKTFLFLITLAQVVVSVLSQCWFVFCLFRFSKLAKPKFLLFVQYGQSWVPSEKECVICSCMESQNIACTPKVCPKGWTPDEPICGSCQVVEVVRGSDPCCPTYQCGKFVLCCSTCFSIQHIFAVRCLWLLHIK